MAFGQQSGLPATTSQVRELLSLLEEAGHLSFRDARGPMGFNQRQAGGRFTRDEAAEIIQRLQDGDTEPDEPAAPVGGGTGPARRVTTSRPAPAPRPAGNPAAIGQVLRNMPSDQLAAELQRRGWLVVEPLAP